MFCLIYSYHVIYRIVSTVSNCLLQGHITEFASEVLNEATEEVADPESELQVCLPTIASSIS